MSPYINVLVKKYGISEQKASEVWKQQKTLFLKRMNLKEEFLNKDSYGTILKNASQFIEKTVLIDISDFVNSNKTAEEFIEQVVSSNFEIGVVKMDDHPEPDKDSVISDEKETEISIDNMEKTDNPDSSKERDFESYSDIDTFLDKELNS